jgi:hypothetical protein
MRYAAKRFDQLQSCSGDGWGSCFRIVSIVQRLSRNAYLNYSTELIVTQGVL